MKGINHNSVCACVCVFVCVQPCELIYTLSTKETGALCLVCFSVSKKANHRQQGPYSQRVSESSQAECYLKSDVGSL